MSVTDYSKKLRGVIEQEILENSLVHSIPGPSAVVFDDQDYILTDQEIQHPAMQAVEAKAEAASLAARAPRIRIASNHGGWNVLGQYLGGGATTTGTDRLAFNVKTPIRGPRLLFFNGYADSSGQVNPVGNALRITAVFERAPILVPISLPNTLAAPISAGGHTASAIGDAQYTFSERIFNGVLQPATNYYYRAHKSVNAGEHWPLIGQTASDWYVDGGTTDATYGSNVADGSDATKSFANPIGAFANGGYFYCASAIIGEQMQGHYIPTVLACGDSISAGANDIQGRGYIVAAIKDAGGIEYLNAGIGGSTMYNNHIFAQPQQLLASYADWVLTHIGTNDLFLAPIPTLADMKQRLLNYLQDFSTATNKVCAATILPRTTSADGKFTTYIGQTVDAQREPIRVQYNNWLRDTSPAGFVAQLGALIGADRVGFVVDGALTVEFNADGTPLALVNGQQTAGTGGLWRADPTPNLYVGSDGTHPTQAGVALLKAAVPTQLITLENV